MVPTPLFRNRRKPVLKDLVSLASLSIECLLSCGLGVSFEICPHFIDILLLDDGVVNLQQITHLGLLLISGTISNRLSNIFWEIKRLECSYEIYAL